MNKREIKIRKEIIRLEAMEVFCGTGATCDGCDDECKPQELAEALVGKIGQKVLSESEKDKNIKELRELIDLYCSPKNGDDFNIERLAVGLLIWHNKKEL